MGVPTQNQLQLRRRHHLPNHVLNVIPDDSLGCGKVADPHPNNPAFDIRNHFVVFPLLNILTHANILRLPMIRLHLAIEIVGPGIFERQKVEGHRLLSQNHLLARKSRFRFFLVQNKFPSANREFSLHHNIIPFQLLLRSGRNPKQRPFFVLFTLIHVNTLFSPQHL